MAHIRTRSRGALSLAVAAALGLAACGGAEPSGEGGAASGGADGEAAASAWILTGGAWSVVENSITTWNEANSDTQTGVPQLMGTRLVESGR